MVARRQVARVKSLFLTADSYLQRNIPMLLRRVLVPLGLQHLQRLDQLLARLARLDHGIHESAVGGHVGIRQAVAEFFDLLLANRFAILGPSSSRL